MGIKQTKSKKIVPVVMFTLCLTLTRDAHVQILVEVKYLYPLYL